MNGFCPNARTDLATRHPAVRAALRVTRHVAAVLALGTVAGCGDDGESLDEATVRLTLTGTGAGTLVTALADGSPPPDVVHTMSCTLAEGVCEASEDLDDDIAAPETIQLTVTAQPGVGSTLVGWSGDCTAAGTPEVATLTLDAERSYTCSAEFDGPPAGATHFEDRFDTFVDNWEAVEVGTFNGAALFWSNSQGNPGGNMGGEQSMGEWLYSIYKAAAYAPATAGAVDSIVYQEDRRIAFPAADVTTASVGAVVAIRQGGIISTAPVPGDAAGEFQNRDWQTRRVVLRASDFTPQPDFSAAGAPMEFGLGRRDEWRTGTLIQYATDNWKVSVYHE
jgi:hypothetical protein